jgi:dihydroflavonol-4-reductase
MAITLVTGGNGFIGQHLVAGLLAQDRRVRILDIRTPARMLPDAQYLEGSVLDAGTVREALRDVDKVYHLAGLPGMWMPDKTAFHEVNCRGTEIVLAEARRRGVERFLHCSTESILFHPSAGAREAEDEDVLLPAEAMPGAYTRSKALAEHNALEAAAAGFPVVIGTPTMPVGAHDQGLTPPAAMLRHFLDRRLQFYLDFIVNLVDVRDVAAGLILAMERGTVGHRYVLGGEILRLRQILQMIAEFSERRNILIPVPAKIAEVAAATIEMFSDHVTRRQPSGTREGVRIALRATELSSAKARRELGFAPRPVGPALLATLNSLRHAGPDRVPFGPRQGSFRVPAE